MGAFAASALAAFERATGRRIVEHFDLIVGTSTGGILALGLGMGVSAEEICAFYETRGPSIFPSRSGLRRYLGRLRDVVRPKYSSSALRNSIRAVIGDRPLGSALTRLAIPSYDVNTGKVYVFKTPHHKGYVHHADLSALDVALATSAAPTYFPAHTVTGRGTFIDGGLWANCPAMVAVVEALDFLQQEPRQVRLLSISTTSYPFRIDEPHKLRGLLNWAPKLIDTFMFGQAQSAINMASCLLRRGLVHRIDYLVPQTTFQMDNARCTGQLIAMGRQIAELNENMEIVQNQFLDGNRIDKYTPIHV